MVTTCEYIPDGSCTCTVVVPVSCATAFRSKSLIVTISSISLVYTISFSPRSDVMMASCRRLPASKVAWTRNVVSWYLVDPHEAPLKPLIALSSVSLK